MHFIAASISSIDHVERFVGPIAEDRIRCDVFKCVAEPAAAIQQYLTHHNADSEPFIQAASATAIFRKPACGRQAENLVD